MRTLFERAFGIIPGILLAALFIYPFFWGVGACYDVMVQSEVVSPILYSGTRSLYLTISIFAMILWAWRYASKPG